MGQKLVTEITSPFANAAVIKVVSGSPLNGIEIGEAVGRWVVFKEEALPECYIPNQKPCV